MENPPLILVADDDRSTRLVMKTAMSQNGYHVVEAENGQEALSVFDTLQPDLVLLDVVMPVMDGFESCRCIRAHPQGGDAIPIVIITASDDIDAIRKAYEAGATDFISKPFNRLVLRERVRYMLRASATARQLYQSQELLAKAQRTACLGSFSYQPGQPELTVSDEFRKIFGFSDPVQPVTWDQFWRKIHPQDRQALAPLMENAEMLGVNFQQDIRIGDFNNGPCFAMLQISAETEKKGKVASLTGIVQDITERKLTELLESDQNQILQRIARKEPLEKIFSETTRLIENQYPQCLVAVSQVAAGTIQIIAAPSLPSRYRQEMDSIQASTENGTCAAAACLGEPVIATDVRTSPFWKGCREIALDHGIRSSASVPIFSGNGQVLGSVSLMRLEPYHTTTAELALMERIANLAALTIEQHELSQRLIYQSQHDPLTGLINRGALAHLLEQIFRQMARTPSLGAYMIIDLDRFKQINDTLGHHVGDLLLQAIAERLRDCVRESDILGRVGGDEFVLIMPEIQDENDAVRAACRMLESFNSPFRIEHHELQVEASIGITLFPQEGLNATELHRNADIAMYVAKNRGGGQFHLFDNKMQEAVVQRLQMENDLRKALERKEFEVHYQPQLDLNSNRIVVLEALIRWNHPERGKIPADRFIKVAEESRLIIPIGRWILKEACRQGKVWKDQGLPPIRIAVNASAVQFSETDFAHTVREALDETGLDANWLEIEITETVVLKDIDKACRNLRRLKDMGVTTTLDDFGTGFSSITYLRQLPLDGLKIDKSFIRDMKLTPTLDGCRNTNFVKAFVTLARNLHLHLVAEGIETEDQSNILKKLGYTIGQGFLFSIPLSAAKASELLTSRMKENLRAGHMD